MDYNQAYGADQAVRAIAAIAPFGIDCAEQPVRAADWLAMARVQRAVDVPLMAHEGCFSLTDIIALIELGAIGVLGINTERPGGITHALRAIDYAVARGMGMGIGDVADVEPAVGLSVATADNELLALPCDPRKAADRISAFSKQDAEHWPAFVARLRSLASFLESLYQLPPPDVDAASIGELAPLVGLGRKFRALGRAGMTETLGADKNHT